MKSLGPNPDSIPPVHCGPSPRLQRSLVRRFAVARFGFGAMPVVLGLRTSTIKGESTTKMGSNHKKSADVQVQGALDQLFGDTFKSMTSLPDLGDSRPSLKRSPMSPNWNVDERRRFCGPMKKPMK